MNTVYATFSDPKMAKDAVAALLDNGVRNENISVVLPGDFSFTSDDRATTGGDIQHSASAGLTTTTGADAAVGAEEGAGLGLVAGAIAALASVFIPGVGLVLGGGALAIAIGGAAGATAAGAVAGGVAGYLKDQGVRDEDVHLYTGAISNGGGLVTVTPTDEKIDVANIEEILVKYGAAITSRNVASSVSVL